MPKYTNLDGTTPDKKLGDFFRWNFVDRRRVKRTEADKSFRPERVANDGRSLFTPSAPAEDALRGKLTWVGHATFAFSLGGVRVVTDPIWASHLGVVRRISPPGISLADMPAVDVVTVSHSHFDHLDIPSLVALSRRDETGRSPTFVVPRDNASILYDAGISRVVELGWWESTRIGSLRVTLVPAQHWSMRAPWDRNERLWGGFVYEQLSDEGTVLFSAYHAGDTAFAPDVFQAIAERFPALDCAMLPIGAYEPRWFMGAQHMDADEAFKAFQILGAQTLAAMHWGTYRLTDEPIAEPPARVRAACADAGVDAERIWVFALGETRELRRSDVG